MLRVQKVDSLDQPELAPYRTMRRQLEHRQQGIFVAEGEKVVRRLLESEFVVVSLLLPEKWFVEYEPLIRTRAKEARVYLAEKKVLERLTGFSMFQGVLAVGKVPVPHTLHSVLQRRARSGLFAAIEGLSNAENVGVVARNCAAFGVQALFVGSTSASPFLRRAVRSSMGAVFRLPVVEQLDLPKALGELRASSVRCIAAHPHTDRHSLPRADLTSDCCLVFGSEGCGISDEVLAACDEAVAIPMNSGVDSLNVGNAAAVFFYEANRQRGKYLDKPSIAKHSDTGVKSRSNEPG
ncbi:MAG TPA: RNA methyltransferase [Candidatus Angelobacter sp.]|nr:RNA methyltransferase [Candidatus Angelobacter sp.]